MKIYSLAEIGRAVGYSDDWVRTAIERGIIPQPDCTIGDRCAYTEPLALAAIEAVNARPKGLGVGKRGKDKAKRKKRGAE